MVKKKPHLTHFRLVITEDPTEKASNTKGYRSQHFSALHIHNILSKMGGRKNLVHHASILFFNDSLTELKKG